MAINQFFLDGNLTRAPEMRYTVGGMPVCSFTIASNTAHGSGDDRREETAFIPITTIGKLAELSYRNLRKGAAVTVVGRLGSWYKAESSKGGFNFFGERVEFRSPRPAARVAEEQSSADSFMPTQVMEGGTPDPRWVQEYEDASQGLTRAH